MEPTVAIHALDILLVALQLNDLCGTVVLGTAQAYGTAARAGQKHRPTL